MVCKAHNMAFEHHSCASATYFSSPNVQTQTGYLYALDTDIK